MTSPEYRMPFALYGSGLRSFADVRSHLADQLLVGARDGELFVGPSTGN